jgi:hypothetical protein
MNFYAILAGGALAILAITEILVSRQKTLMKKQFLEELSSGESQNREKSDSPPHNKSRN